MVNTHRTYRTALLTVALMGFSSTGCSLFSNRKPVSEHDLPTDGRTIPKAQYDHLLHKYEALLKEYRKKEEQLKVLGEVTPSSSGLQEAERALLVESQGQGEYARGGERGKLTGEIAHREGGVETREVTGQGRSEEDLTETVNVLSGDSVSHATAALHENPDLAVTGRTGETAHPGGLQNLGTSTQSQESSLPFGHLDRAPVGEEKLEREIIRFEEAKKFINKNQYAEAMKILHTLENSDYKQIKVRAKFAIGEILVKQNEYDLGMQIFEDILQNYAFSGLVLKSLEYLVVCSEKLKLEKKVLSYRSMLKDFFQEG